MKRKPVDPKPIVFYRPAWTVGIHTRAQLRTTARRMLFRQYIWRLPQASPADIKDRLTETIESFRETDKT